MMLRSDRRTFLGLLASLAGSLASKRRESQQPVIEVRPTALFQQPEGRKNLVRITVSGLSAPAARARVTDRRGALVGTAGLLPSAQGVALSGEVWVPLSEPSDFQVDIEVGRDRAARRRLRLTPAKRWTLYWLPSIHTDVGYTDLQERTLEVHRRNLDAALAWTTTHRDFRFTAECALQVLSYLENRSAEAGDALVQAISGGKIAWQGLFANMLTGLLDHETYARLVWPAGKLARERGLTVLSAQITDVPGQTLTFPMLLAASGVKYLASGPNPERAVPLLPSSGGVGAEGTIYPQLYYWEGPDGSRVLHWRAHHYGDGTRFGFDVGPDEMGHRLSDWLLNQPTFLAQNWPYDTALLYGADWQDNAPMKEAMVANLQEFARRYLFPRVIPGRAEDFFRDVERRFGPRIPVRRGDTGVYWEDGAASTAAQLAAFRAAQLSARAAEIVSLWDDRIEPRDADVLVQRRERAGERTAMWRDLLLFGEHTWGADESISAPASRQTVAQWEYKKRFIDAGAAAAREQLSAGLLRLGRAARAGRGRLVFNAGTWERTDVAHVPGGAGKALNFVGSDLAAVDLEDGDALVQFREVPALGYLVLSETDRDARPPAGDGETRDAKAGGFAVQPRPLRRLDALLPVRARERTNGAACRIELHRKAAGLRVARLAIAGRRPCVAIRFAQDEIAKGGHFAKQHERVTILQVHRGEIATIKVQCLPGAPRNARDVGALPRTGVEHEPPATRPGRAPEAQQAGGQLLACGGRAGIAEPLLVRPLRHGLARSRRIDAFCRAPRVLAEEQQVAPHRGPRIGTLAAALHGIVVARLDPVVPQREDLAGARRELRRPERGQLGGGRSSAVFPIETRIAAPVGNLCAVATLYVLEEVFGTSSHDARPRKPAAELLHVRDDRFLHQGIVLPVGAV